MTAAIGILTVVATLYFLTGFFLTLEEGNSGWFFMWGPLAIRKVFRESKELWKDL